MDIFCSNLTLETIDILCLVYSICAENMKNRHKILIESEIKKNDTLKKSTLYSQYI